MDLGFFSSLLGLIAFTLVSGAATLGELAQSMRLTLAGAIAGVAAPQHAQAALEATVWPAARAVSAFAATIAAVTLLFEIVQLRGLTLSFHPLKPDFSRLNPAKGLKRLFSMRMLKETAKSIVKLVLYALGAFIVIRFVFELYAQGVLDASSLAAAFHDGGLRLLFMFTLIALAVAAMDQVIARGEFRKQMRMSRSELDREIKDREGEPRLKNRRRQLHAGFASQTRALGDLRGSDMLIVNPEHYAVGLVYDRETMAAPKVTAKGRNRFALLLRRKAALLSIAIVEAPPLARALYKTCEKGQEAAPEYYRDIAELYLRFARARAEAEVKRNA
jgi:flagellar biosynthetic protein FlhB